MSFCSIDMRACPIASTDLLRPMSTSNKLRANISAAAHNGDKVRDARPRTADLFLMPQRSFKVGR
jgi:hypothetical protein